jgi:hypothetical protein
MAMGAKIWVLRINFETDQHFHRVERGIARERFMTLASCKSRLWRGTHWPPRLLQYRFQLAAKVEHSCLVNRNCCTIFPFVPLHFSNTLVKIITTRELPVLRVVSPEPKNPRS